MHEILELKGKLEGKKRKGIIGPSTLPKNGFVNNQKIKKLIVQLKDIQEYWKNDKYISSSLITVYYTKIVAKSNRIRKLFSYNCNKDPNDSIVGARFESNKHVITYHIEKNTIDLILNRLELIVKILDNIFEGTIDSSTLNEVNQGVYNTKLDNYNLAKSTFADYIVDIYYIDKLSIDKKESSDGIGDIIVTLFDLKDELLVALEKIGIQYLSLKKINDTTFLLSREQYNKLVNETPYLIAMQLDDLNNFVLEHLGNVNNEEIIQILEPSNEPIIGVIDTLFDVRVYFSKWVEVDNSYINKDLIEQDDYIHGTEITSLIVNGHIMNKKLDDGCGYFRVRHFGVAKNGKMSSFNIIKNIEQIVKNNPDIIVWNLSLGSEKEVDENFISFEGAILDELQSKYGVIFIVAGTNKNNKYKSERIGAPADSINAIVVNSTKIDGTIASYSRKGPVLSFYNKPDVCYFGGDENEYVRVCNGNGEAFRQGTSYAAPWITRKIAYLIHKLGLPKEIAKALLIDSTTSWNKVSDSPTLMGYGKVPLRIEDIISTRNDEIKFYIYGFAEKYDTYTYNIPVPIVKSKQPFITKATMCYFPSCSRNQGVDYTNIELDMHFGKIYRSKKGLEIKCVNDNKQNIPDFYGGNEEDARKEYRKWDNVKHICEKEKNRKIAKDVYEDGLWGLSIKKVNRLSSMNNNEKTPFGIVITLKNIYGEDHFEEFIQQCSFRSWIVNRINVQEKIDLYNKIEEEISLD